MGSLEEVITIHTTEPPELTLGTETDSEGLAEPCSQDSEESEALTQTYQWVSRVFDGVLGQQWLDAGLALSAAVPARDC